MNEVNSPKSPLDGTQTVLEAETVLDTYSVVAEWIRFADAKAAVTLTVNGVLLGVLVPALKAYFDEEDAVRPFVWWNALVIGLFAVWFILLSISAIYSFRCILPFRGTGRQDGSLAYHALPSGRRGAEVFLERSGKVRRGVGSHGDDRIETRSAYGTTH
ncbi:MAG: hypothetical protein QM775_27510 [Pirellulales bacterium]